jgi:heptosyltransferase II
MQNNRGAARSGTIRCGTAGDLVTSRNAQRAREALAGARRIAVLTKFRFMGDTVVATPFLAQLRQQLPSAEIDLLAAPCIVDTFANCPHLNSIKPVEMAGVSRWRHGRDLRSLLKQGKYDAAFILNRSLHSAVTTALSRIPVRIGYANELRQFLLTVPIPYAFDRNEVDCHLDMLRAIGMEASHALPDLWVTDAERQAAREMFSEMGVDATQPIMGLQPGANDPYIREWGAERFANAAASISREIGAAIVLMGGKEELQTVTRTEAALKALGVQPLNLCGKLKLRQALSAIGACSLWLGNDTGLLHCAVAQRVPSVGIFGPNKVLRWGYDCARHKSIVYFPENPAHDDHAVRRALDCIPESEVVAALRQVYSATSELSGCAGSPEYAPTSQTSVVRAPYFSMDSVAVPAVAAARRR